MKRLILTTIVTSTLLFGVSGEELAKTNGCMECHNIMGQKAAPAFMGTARKNIRWFGENAKVKMIESIKNGSKGKYRNFADTEMPAYGHLSNTDLDTITSWIFAQYDKNRANRTNNQGQGRK